MTSTVAHRTEAGPDYTWAVAVLAERRCLPDRYDAIFVGGSVARGWSNALSDLDLYVIAPARWSSRTSRTSAVPVEPGTISTEVFRVDGRRWEVKYWLTSQVEQVLTQVDWNLDDRTPVPARRIGLAEEFLLGRICHCSPVAGHQWLTEMQRRIDRSAFRLTIAAQELDSADQLVEDALGQLDRGDMHSAVLSARLAFGHAVDALLATHGECGAPIKWRPRRMQAITQDILTYQDYWEMETMCGFDPQAPEDWVMEAVDLCRRISREASL